MDHVHCNLSTDSANKYVLSSHQCTCGVKVMSDFFIILYKILPTSLLPLSTDYFMQRYVQKRVLSPKCPNMVIRSKTLWKLKILKIFTVTRSIVWVRFQRALYHYLQIILCKDMSQKRVLSPKCPNMVIRSHTLWKLKILKIFTVTRSIVSVRFQRALNHYIYRLFYSKICPKRCFGPQIPKYGNSVPYPLIIENLEKCYRYYKRVTNTLPTSPQPMLWIYMRTPHA